ncbi:hypothetical protein NKJ46_29895 [Mesorhizobium sp. M0166]|uniref:hypothetical protein n=1 Tax=Mesorhizobium sp. M0166 TaxID=2956902 RepID=UPI00333C61FB
MERHEAWFVAITSAVIGFIVGMAWSDLNHQARWLYDYQTLFAGALAVAAAFITVNAMNKTEERQQKRHDELIKLNLRSDRLTAERAGYLANYFLGIANDAESAAGNYKKFEVKSPPRPTSEEINKLKIFCDRIELGLEMKAIESGVRLFGPEMTSNLEVMTLMVRNFRPRWVHIKELMGKKTTEAGRSLAHELKTIAIDAVIIQKQVRNFAEGLGDLAKIYQ